jgi:hypothetical protein
VATVVVAATSVMLAVATERDACVVVAAVAPMVVQV